MNSVFVAIPDDSFRGRTDDQFFFKFRFRVDDDSFSIRAILESVVRHNRTFFSKSFYMRSFFTEERFWNQEGKVSIYMPGILEHLIEDISDIFPDGVAIRFDDHTSSHIRIFRHIGDFDDVIVSFAVIFSAGGYLISH